MTTRVDMSLNPNQNPDQLASSDSWICTVCKGRAYPGSAGPGISQSFSKLLGIKSGNDSLFREYQHL